MNSTRVFPSSGYNPRSVVTAARERRVLNAEKQFVRWLNRKHPDILNRAIKATGAERSTFGLSGLGQTDDSEKAWYDKLLDYVPEITSGYMAIEQQKELIKLNRERAKQGLDPLNSAPAIQVEAGQGTQQALKEGIMGAAAQYIPWIAAGLGILFLTRSKPKGRR